MMTAPCNCDALADRYKRARREENISIGQNGIHDPVLRANRADAWERYEKARANCPFRRTYPHY